MLRRSAAVLGHAARLALLLVRGGESSAAVRCASGSVRPLGSASEWPSAHGAACRCGCRASVRGRGWAHGCGLATQAKAEEESAAGSRAGEGPEELPSVEALLALLGEKEAALEETVTQAAELKDKVLRAHAEMENLRSRTAVQSEKERRFAVQALVKDLLEVADNMERALQALPAHVAAAAEEGTQPEGAEGPAVALHQLAVGLSMTAKALHKALGKHHVQRFQPQPGEALDPNCMSALFQLPVAGQEKGTVAVVTKSGYRLNERVIRPAEVGVVA